MTSEHGMSVSRVLLLLAVAGCHCARNKPSGRDEVRFESKDEQFVRPKIVLTQANGGSGLLRVGVQSPRLDVVGPRDVTRRRPGARRAYEAGVDLAAEVEDFPKEYYNNADQLVDTDKPLQSDDEQLYNVHMRGRIERPSTQSGTPITLFSTRNLMTPRKRLRTLWPNLSISNDLQNILHFETTLVGYGLPHLDNIAPTQEPDLPIFSEDPADLAAETETVGLTGKTNLSKAIAKTDKPVAVDFTPRFRLNNRSQASHPSVPKKERFENFVKFIQANNDLVDEYIQKNRGSYQVSSHGNHAEKHLLGRNSLDSQEAQGGHAQSVHTQAGHVGVPRWSVDPASQGEPKDTVVGKNTGLLTGRGPMGLSTGRGPMDLPFRRSPMGLLTGGGTVPIVRHRLSYRTSKSITTQMNHVLSGEKMEEYSTISNSRLVDMAPARGALISRMRHKGRICQRHVLMPEGPKYNRRGAVHLKEFKSIYGKDFPQTRAPRVILPACCNCCRKSVLGCE
ncbi:uncharacterized protein LOC113238822 [Hyposmocoma kahamanoa]|uniref:uncharacterized protein LOC113238822 n=1 Tax=Hyposmocoma kahamanoa TaxID=1477025 RepID=UPI000E6D666C|nr:uncharacterized protein LOC113238822 [Hyposmocoma kahamanoa]